VTADDVFVLSHNAHVRTVNGGSIAVAKTALADLYDRAETGPYGEDAYPTLEHVLSRFAGKHAPGAELAIHLKESSDGLETDLRDLVASVDDRFDTTDLFESVFVFDAPMASSQRFADRTPRLRVGLSVGDDEFAPDERHSTVYTYDQVRSLDFEIVWADEWLGSLYSEAFVNQCRADGRTVICISPELHLHTTPMHPDAEAYTSRWQSLATIGADGICTDHPNDFEKFIDD
jgi:glycerophosphoryl diester phosphodiesterase